MMLHMIMRFGVSFCCCDGGGGGGDGDCGSGDGGGDDCGSDGVSYVRE